MPGRKKKKKGTYREWENNETKLRPREAGKSGSKGVPGRDAKNEGGQGYYRNSKRTREMQRKKEITKTSVSYDLKKKENRKSRIPEKLRISTNVV